MNDSSMSPQDLTKTSAIIAKELIKNLPEIIGSLKEIYALRSKKQAFQAALHARCVELQINEENFGTLVQSLTELSKTEGSDEATKDMYREMIRSLFDLFAQRSRDSSAFSEFMNT